MRNIKKLCDVILNLGQQFRGNCRLNEFSMIILAMVLRGTGMRNI